MIADSGMINKEVELFSTPFFNTLKERNFKTTHRTFQLFLSCVDLHHYQ